MRTIVLRRGGGYRYKDIVFELNVPKVVDTEIADHLLSLGRFAPIDMVSSDVLDGITMLDGPPDGFIEDRKNVIEQHDLNGKRVLLRRTGGIGDQVFVALFAECLKSKFPDCSIHAAVQDSIVDFVRCFDVYDKVHTLNSASGVRLVNSFHFIIPFDSVLGSESAASSDNKEYFSAHWERAGMPEPPPDKLPTLRINSLVGNLSAHTEAVEELRRVGFGSDEYVVLLLGTSNPLKRLTKKALKRISHTLAAPNAQREGHSRIRVLCLGDSNDRTIQSDTPWVVCSTDTSIQASAELVRRARCVIGADTGLLHFAAAIGAPTVSLWGPTTAAHTLPRYPSETRFVTSDLPCAPCNRLRTSGCTSYRGGYTECMKMIDVDETIANARDLLSETSPHPASLLTAEQVLSERKERNDRYHIAVLLDHAGSYTGGGFYTWNLAKLLASLPSVHVTVFMDVAPDKFVYTQEDVLPPASSMSVVQYHDKIASWTSKLHFDLVVGNPPETGIAAVAYAKATETKSALLLYETPQYIAKFRKGLDTKEAYWAAYKEAIPKADFVWVISKSVREALYDWVPKLKDMKPGIWTIWPVINQAVADVVLNETEEEFFMHKTNSVVMIARNMPYKKLRTSLHAIATEGPKAVGGSIDLTIIGANVRKLEKAISPDWKNCTVTLLENVSERDKWGILAYAKAVVHPSTFEGFGIPVAEGLYAGAQVIARPLPVLQNAFGETIRTYTNDTELIQQLSEVFADWKSLELFDESAEREVGEHIAAEERQTFVRTHFVPGIIRASVSKALRDDLAEYQKRVAAERNDLALLDKDTDIRVAMVSPWNTKCGIAETTQAMLENLSYPYHVFSYRGGPLLQDDGSEVTRCWTRDFDSYLLLLNQILDFNPSVVHIQHEHSLFVNQEKFFEFLGKLREYGLRTIVTLHTWLPSRFTDRLASAVDLVVNTKPQEDVPSNFTNVLLPVDKVEIKPRVAVRRELGISGSAFVVGAFGMWQSHKGFHELFDTYNDVSTVVGDNTVYLVSGSAPRKSQYLQSTRRKVKELVVQNRILLLTDYVSMADVVSRLAACDVLVFNYSIAHHSSASAAIRTGMLSGVPIICTHSPMFSEFTHGKEVLKVKFADRVGLTNTILQLRNDPKLGAELVAECKKYMDNCTSDKIAKEYMSVYRTVVYGNEEEEE